MASLATSYDPRALRPSGTPHASRFFRTCTPAGWPCEPGAVLAHCANTLSHDLALNTPQLVRTVEIPLLYAKRSADGDYRLVERGRVAGEPTRVPVELSTPRRRYQGAELLDRFLLGDPRVYPTVSDPDAWEALLHVARAHALDKQPLRQLNDAVARLVCLRHGLDVGPDRLPQGMLT